MARHLSPNDLPEDIARFAEAQIAAGKFSSIEEVLRAGVEALENHDQRLARPFAEQDEDNPQLESDDELKAFLDEAAADYPPRDWTDYLRYRFDEGRKAIARGEYFAGPSSELMARIRERVEAKHR